MPIIEVTFGSDVRITHPELVNLFGCVIEDESMIGPFVEIQMGVRVGKRYKTQSHSFICEGVTIGDGVLVDHGVMFTNERHPQSVRSDSEFVGRNAWIMETTVVQHVINSLMDYFTSRRAPTA